MLSISSDDRYLPVLDNLTLDQLRMLATVAEAGSFSAAGRRLGRVQSAVSQSIQTLEQALGLALFDRATKTPILTEAGRAMVVQARRILAQTEALKAQASAISTGLEPELTLAVDNLFPSPPLLESLHSLNARFPHLPVTLYTEAIGASETRLRAGDAQLALCCLFPGSGSDLVSEPLTWIELIAVAAATHPLAQADEPIGRETLELHTQLVLTDPLTAGSGLSFGVVSPRVWRFVDLGRRLDFLRAGFGWCAMPAHVVRPLIETGELVELRLRETLLPPGGVPISAVHRRHQAPGLAGRWFLERLKAICGADANGAD
jgi:DNA-binding transcriptional LysR family regulator